MKEMLAPGLMIFGMLGAQTEGGKSDASLEGTVFFFFSPDAPQSPAAAKARSVLAAALKGKFRIRPVLLIEDWKTFRKPTEDSPIYRTVRELGGGGPPGVSLPVYDLEGLRLARAWNLSRLPAFVLITQGKAHVVYGSRLDLEDLARCGR